MPLTARIVSAGAVVTRKADEILLVHRPKYDDWSFPKGKLDPGEHVVSAAVREVAEETGLDIRLGPPLGTQTYLVDDGRPKDVHYWVGRVVGGDVATYRPNDEVDEVLWLPLDRARERLSYPYDRETLERYQQLGSGSVPLVVLRHSRARSRTSWSGDDLRRPLTEAGRFQSQQLVPVLAAYGVRRVVSSLARRCSDTVRPYADELGVDSETTAELTEDGATGEVVSEYVRALLATGEPAVLCTHRPVLPWVFEALALQQRSLEPGSMFVAHHHRGRVRAVEQHDISFR